MDTTFLSLLLFIICTIIYFRLIKNKTVAEVNGAKPGKYIYTVAYFVIVIILQWITSVIYIISTCGGDVLANFGYAAVITLVRWIFIFGAVIVMIIFYPGLKSAFSNVIGYFWVARHANKILSSLLIDTDIKDNLQQLNPVDKNKLSHTAELILKICTDKSILINQLTPSNFNKMWEMLLTLSNDAISEESKNDLKVQLLNITILKDNIGEALWYVYTAILVISMVSSQLTSRSCMTSIAAIRQSQDEYTAYKTTTDQQTAASNTAVYAI
jgi:hypothetical protein